MLVFGVLPGFHGVDESVGYACRYARAYVHVEMSSKPDVDCRSAFRVDAGSYFPISACISVCVRVFT